MGYIDDLIEDTGAYDCVECGKCTTVCPIAAYNPEFAPRLIVVKALEGLQDNLADEKDIWTCITCEMCNDMCPYEVNYSEFVRGMRVEAAKSGNTPLCSQAGLLHTMMRMMAKPNLKQNRLGWVDDSIKIAEKGDIFYFVGCLPQLDVIFSEDDLKLTEIAKSAIRIMNRAGIVPVVSSDERCCGHDLNWVGDELNTRRLMNLNIDLIRKSGAKTVVFTCPECYRTFDMDYQDILGDLEFELVHISDFICDLIDDGKLSFPEALEETVTYHDSCRLGRHMGVYDAPRRILKEIKGLDLVEMERNREKASCCGVSAWAYCDSYSKMMQVDRLMEAKRTGADKLLSFCPKCLIHFNCAATHEVPVDKALVDIQVKDFTVEIAKALGRN